MKNKEKYKIKTLLALLFWSFFIFSCDNEVRKPQNSRRARTRKGADIILDFDEKDEDEAFND